MKNYILRLWVEKLSNIYDVKLGAFRENSKTCFRVFAPNREEIDLVIFNENGADTFDMKKEKMGTFYIELESDLEGREYAYMSDEYVVIDPYVKKLNKDKTRGVVLFPKGNTYNKLDIDPDTAVIYETHVKDFTMDKSVPFSKTPFKAMAESFNVDGVEVGLNHIKELGANYVHLLPIQDIASIKDDTYNWGYDPEFYFALENSYGSPEDFREMVEKFHEKGIGVVMDVVYNHTYRNGSSVFEKLAPGNYYRMNENGFSNGSGVGSELDTSKDIVRKLIVESLEYMLDEYNVDGFRFDLLGLMDKETTYYVFDILKKKKPNILLYGEPWTGGPTILSQDEMTLKGTNRGKGFALFNDTYRDALRGDNNPNSIGYISNEIICRTGMISGIAGSIDFSDDIKGPFENPGESINYFSCHDNFILRDKLVSSGTPEELVDRRTRLAFSILALSFGKMFIQSGTEMGRTKNMCENSYNAGYEINCLFWNLKKENLDLFEYVKKLISFRRELKLDKFSSEDIRKKLLFYINDRIISYKLETDMGNYYVGINPTPESVESPFAEIDAEIIIENSIFTTGKYHSGSIMPESVIVVREK
ncbi:MAG: type I pullulanase [Clostridiales bacterium]|nr:MAG: type I pullulanase [Clostridiales bacterium]